MFDFSEARTHMMDSQILTAGVISPPVIHAFETVPRERFVPDNYAQVAYNDEDIPVGQGRFLLEPLVYAKILEALDLKKNDVVLDVGCGSGYSSAILSGLVSTVVALEPQKELLARAESLWSSLGVCNVASVCCDLEQGCEENAPYDAIIFNGALAEVPQGILKQLAPQGRLVAIVKPQGNVMGDVILLERNGDNFSSYPLFEAGCPYLPEFLPKQVFKF